MKPTTTARNFEVYIQAVLVATPIGIGSSAKGTYGGVSSTGVEPRDSHATLAAYHENTWTPPLSVCVPILDHFNVESVIPDENKQLEDKASHASTFAGRFGTVDDNKDQERPAARRPNPTRITSGRIFAIGHSVVTWSYRG